MNVIISREKILPFNWKVEVPYIMHFRIFHNWKFSNAENIFRNNFMIYFLNGGDFARNPFNTFSIYSLLMVNLISIKGLIRTQFTPLTIIHNVFDDAHVHIIDG